MSQANPVPEIVRQSAKHGPVGESESTAYGRKVETDDESVIAYGMSPATLPSKRSGKPARKEEERAPLAGLYSEEELVKRAARLRPEKAKIRPRGRKRWMGAVEALHLKEQRRQSK